MKEYKKHLMTCLYQYNRDRFIDYSVIRKTQKLWVYLPHKKRPEIEDYESRIIPLNLIDIIFGESFGFVK